MTHQYPDIFKGEDVFLDVLAEKVAQNLERRQSGEASKSSIAPSTQDGSVVNTVEVAGHMLATRRRRDEVFGSDLFGEPAWDIMLDLFVAEAKGRRVSVSSACIAASVPPTTALRWIGNLQERGVIARRQDAFDARRTWLTLTPEWNSRIHDLLAELLSGSLARLPAKQWIAMSK